MEITTIVKKEYEDYKKGKIVKSINSYFKNILSKLPMELRLEAKGKGFRLDEGSTSMDILTLHVIVPNASNELKDAISNDYIFCYLDL